jgi:hypothetical protein|uniref:Uncharacterized protein n=1 Tax=Myoviridae sp. ctRci5 TaxID=2825105 RepID=A0A8S5V6S1_9CAUD|nr:MAG TPA: hypothetical protein [Myoviridae sp. ctRci5]
MNALKTLHGEIATRAYERLADHYAKSEITYRTEETEAAFYQPEGWLDMSILHYCNDGKSSCFLYLYTDQSNFYREIILSKGTPEQLEAAINKLIEGKKA